MKDKISLTINDVAIEKWNSLSIEKDIFQGCGKMEASVSPQYLFSPSEEPLKFVVSVNDTPFMSGWIDETERDYAKGTMTYRIMGRDILQTWVDNSLLVCRNYSGYSLENMVKTLINENKSATLIKKVDLPPEFSRWSITDRAKQTAAKLIRKIEQRQSSPGQTVWDFLSPICNQIGLVIYATADEIVIDQLAPLSEDEDFVFASGRGFSNVISGRYIERNSYHPFFRIQGVSTSVDYTADEYKPFEDRAVNSRLLVEKFDETYKGLVKFQVIPLQGVERNAIEQQNPQEVTSASNALVRNYEITKYKELFELVYTTAGWTAESGVYDINKTIMTGDAWLGSGDFVPSFLISRVLLKVDRQSGLISELTCMLPPGTLPFSGVYASAQGNGYIVADSREILETMEAARYAND